MRRSAYRAGMMPAEFWSTTLAETVAFVEEARKGRWLHAWNAAVLNAAAYHDPKKLPKSEATLFGEKPKAVVVGWAEMMKTLVDDEGQRALLPKVS